MFLLIILQFLNKLPISGENYSFYCICDTINKEFIMKKFFILIAIMLIGVQSLAVDYIKIEPEFLQPSQCKSYEAVNETLAIIFSKLKTQIRTNKYPKYYHDFTLIKDDGTQNSAYFYVKNLGTELMYNTDTNELKYITIRRPELEKTRIYYDYPSGKLHAVQIFADNQSFIFDANGKYVDYAPYINEVQKKVNSARKLPSRKQIEEFAKGQKDLLVQTALTLNKDGSIKKVRVLKSSNIKELDKNTLEAINEAQPFEKFPQNFFNEEITIILNFNFSL